MMKPPLTRDGRRGSLADQGFHIKSYGEWQPELDDALQGLPEGRILTHELFRSLMRMAEPRKRRIVLVKEKGIPVGIVGLRNRWGYWEPVTQWIIPGVLFPVREGTLDRILTQVLTSLGIDIRVAWWRWETPPPRNRLVRGVHSTPTHRMRLLGDFEGYWRKSRNFKNNLHKYRNRCKGFSFEVNRPGAAEWTIHHCEAKWRPKGIGEAPDRAERMAVAQYLEGRGLHYTLSLLEHDMPVAGIACIKHHNDVVAYANYRDPRYDWHGVMTRLMDLSFYWAREMGFEKIDIGGSFDYKEKWAPEDGEKWEFEIGPLSIYLKNSALRLLRKGWERLHRGLAGGDRDRAR